jgi:hypothetical protein
MLYTLPPLLRLTPNPRGTQQVRSWLVLTWLFHSGYPSPEVPHLEELRLVLPRGSTARLHAVIPLTPLHNLPFTALVLYGISMRMSTMIRSFLGKLGVVILSIH